jgi:hypothetical protein
MAGSCSGIFKKDMTNNRPLRRRNIFHLFLFHAAHSSRNASFEVKMAKIQWMSLFTQSNYRYFEKLSFITLFIIESS